MLNSAPALEKSSLTLTSSMQRLGNIPHNLDFQTSYLAPQPNTPQHGSLATLFSTPFECHQGVLASYCLHMPENLIKSKIILLLHNIQRKM